MKKILLLAVIGLISFTSCKKDDPIAAPTREDFLTDKDWKIAEYNGTLDDCYKDDVISFDKSGKFVFDYGVNKCGGINNPQLLDSLTGTWIFFDDETKVQTSFLVAAGVTIKDTLSIVKLDENNFEYVGKGKTWKLKH